jgi:H+/Na+-translocating ferredoxin:NAD+ oxidoreductase subunit G
MSEKKNPNLFVLGIFLGVIGAIAAGLLAFADRLTAEPIKKAQLQKTCKALEEVLPKFDNVPAEEIFSIKAKNGTKVTYYAARMDGEIVGIAGQGYSKKGFAGKVVVMLGMDSAGKINTVIVTEQKETPGLGTVVTDRVREKTIFDLFSSKKVATGLPPNRILDGFAGHTAILGGKAWAVKKDGGEFAFITGATITSRAVTDAVYTVDSTFVDNKETILSKFSGSKIK